MAAADRATLEFQPPPPDIAAQVIGFIHRDDVAAGHVVRVLPEVRASIQIMLADPYWLRGADGGAAWETAPRIALWGPKYHWCYGFAAGHVKAYAVGLTMSGLLMITGRPASQIVDQVLDLRAVHPVLASTLYPQGDESFDSWRQRAAFRLHDSFAGAPRIDDPVAASLASLAIEDGGAVARAADSVGLSERQYRRLFYRFYGVAPKQYQRAVRVDRMLRQLHDFPWEPDAHSDPIPFSDQSHAIREFRAMTGMTPRAYLQAKHSRDATLRSVPVQDVPPPRLLDR